MAPPPQAVPVDLGSEGMQLGSSILTPEEQRRHQQSSLCLYYGGKGHFVSSSPVKSGLTRVVLPAALPA